MLVETEDLLTTEQAAVIAGCSIRTLQRRVSDGRGPPPAIMLSGRARYLESEVRAWAESRQAAPKPKPLNDWPWGDVPETVGEAS
jgi:predicted DNA-binding transcriptional regulator AlpA